jgi:hypothetical protein
MIRRNHPTPRKKPGGEQLLEYRRVCRACVESRNTNQDEQRDRALWSDICLFIRNQVPEFVCFFNNVVFKFDGVNGG